MPVNVTPLHDRVLVRRLEEKETAKGGIIIPDTAKEKPHEGEVMAVGAGKIEKGKKGRVTAHSTEQGFGSLTIGGKPTCITLVFAPCWSTARLPI